MVEPGGGVLAALRETVGTGAVRAGTAADAVHGVTPAAVATPPDPAAVAAALAHCSAEGWAVEPAGAGGRMDWGRPPARVDVLLSTRALDAVEDYVPGDLVATAGAGVAMGALAERLATARQWLPLDPPGSASASVGAVFAQGSAGALQGSYGAPRDLALGLEVATGDGRLLALGGRVVKNVAGYDLVRLMVGSRGTLGVLTRVHLRLRPLPAVDRTLDLGAPSAEGAADAALAVRWRSLARGPACQAARAGGSWSGCTATRSRCRTWPSGRWPRRRRAAPVPTAANPRRTSGPAWCGWARTRRCCCAWPDRRRRCGARWRWRRAWERPRASALSTHVPWPRTP
jgi:glycolate oxidase FAD binding subunit